MIHVVGGGPAGCYFAGLMAEKGYSVNVFEEHKVIGEPWQCTGIVTSSIEKLIALDPSVVVNRVMKVKVFAPSGKFQEFSVNDIILDRAGFDKYIAKIARDKGVRFFLGHKFLGKERKYLLIQNKKNKKIKKFRCEAGDVLVGADGPFSSVAKSAGLLEKRRYYYGAQATARLDSPKEVYEVYLGEKYCPKFFAWVVPESKGVVRIGLASFSNTKNYFQKFLNFRLGEDFQKKIIKYQGGAIPCYNPKINVQRGNVFLIGDAGCHVKATTGGGIIQGMIAGKCLAEAILEKKDYGKLLRKYLSKDLMISLQIRKTMNRFEDKDYDRLMVLLNQKRIKNIIEKYDRDYPSRFLISLLIKEPRFLLFGKKLLF